MIILQNASYKSLTISNLVFNGSSSSFLAINHEKIKKQKTFKLAQRSQSLDFGNESPLAFKSAVSEISSSRTLPRPGRLSKILESPAEVSKNRRRSLEKLDCTPNRKIHSKPVTPSAIRRVGSAVKSNDRRVSFAPQVQFETVNKVNTNVSIFSAAVSFLTLPRKKQRLNDKQKTCTLPRGAKMSATSKVQNGPSKFSKTSSSVDSLVDWKQENSDDVSSSLFNSPLGMVRPITPPVEFNDFPPNCDCMKDFDSKMSTTDINFNNIPITPDLKYPDNYPDDEPVKPLSGLAHKRRSVDVEMGLLNESFTLQHKTRRSLATVLMNESNRRASFETDSDFKTVSESPVQCFRIKSKSFDWSDEQLRLEAFDKSISENTNLDSDKFIVPSNFENEGYHKDEKYPAMKRYKSNLATALFGHFRHLNNRKKLNKKVHRRSTTVLAEKRKLRRASAPFESSKMVDITKFSTLEFGQSRSCDQLNTNIDVVTDDADDEDDGNLIIVLL